MPTKINPEVARIRPEDELRYMPGLEELPPAPAKRLRPRKDGSRRERRSIIKVRNSMAKLLETNAPKFEEWLERAAQDNPMKALILMKDLAEYFLPKLGRIEQTGTVEHKVSHFVPMIQREEPPAGYLGGKQGSEVIEGEVTEVPK